MRKVLMHMYNWLGLIYYRMAILIKPFSISVKAFIWLKAL